jgi:hypothetical protein
MGPPADAGGPIVRGRTAAVLGRRLRRRPSSSPCGDGARFHSHALGYPPIMTLLPMLQPWIDIAPSRVRDRFADESGISVVGTVLAFVIVAVIVVIAVIEWLVPND